MFHVKNGGFETVSRRFRPDLNEKVFLKKRFDPPKRGISRETPSLTILKVFFRVFMLIFCNYGYKTNFKEGEC